MKFIIGKKLEMTQKFDEQGNVIPVTAIKAGPCLITQVKSGEKEGYGAIQLCFGKKKNLNKPQQGHIKDLKGYLKEDPQVFKEFRCDSDKFKVGQVVKADVFAKDDKVSVSGNSKGRGFAGVVKRHNFGGSPASHGHKDQLRMPGSIGATGPARVFKGTKMPGRMGNESVSVKNLKVVDIDSENNIIYLKGPVPGARNSIVYIKADGEMELKHFSELKPQEPEVKKEETETEAESTQEKVEAAAPQATAEEQKPKEAKTEPAIEEKKEAVAEEQPAETESQESSENK